VQKTATKTLNVGDQLPVISKTISQRQIDCFSGVRPQSIHTDEAWAKKKGFRTTLVQAMMSTGYIAQLMTAYLGTGFIRGGKMSMSFIQPVFEGETLTVHGVVKSREQDGGRERVTVEVWCQSKDGVKTAVGTASGYESDLAA
jgi:3-hydroxybutyryl-CoA dehydratase